MQDAEVIKLAKLLDLRQERAQSLWMFPFCDIAIDWKLLYKLGENSGTMLTVVMLKLIVDSVVDMLYRG